MKSLKNLYNIKYLENFLFIWLNQHYYKASTANYLDILEALLNYDEESKVERVTFKVSWGRYYEDKEKEYLNESHITYINIDFDYIDNYSYILGVFTEVVENQE